MNIFWRRISISKDCGNGPPLRFRNNGLIRPADAKKRERGSAILVVLVLMGIMTTLVICNSVTLRQLRQELNLIERQQLKKFEGRARADQDHPKKQMPKQK